ncbi:hypothetical protein [Halomonas sp. WWR20]
MAEIQTITLDVAAQGEKGASVEIRLERGETGFSARADQGGAVIGNSEEPKAVDALAACLEQVATVVGGDNIRSAQLAGHKLMGDAEFAKACRHAQLEIPASR